MPTPSSLSIRLWLDGMGVPYRHVTHGPTRTSEELALARGESLETGAKALLLKTDESFGLFVLSASLQLDNGAVRRETGARRVRFATRDELLELTSLEPGSIPPFGFPILPFELFLDDSILKLDRVAFNAASLTESLVMQRAEYQRAASPARVFRFSRGSE